MSRFGCSGFIYYHMVGPLIYSVWFSFPDGEIYVPDVRQNQKQSLHDDINDLCFELQNLFLETPSMNSVDIEEMFQLLLQEQDWSNEDIERLNVEYDDLLNEYTNADEIDEAFQQVFDEQRWSNIILTSVNKCE